MGGGLSTCCGKKNLETINFTDPGGGAEPLLVPLLPKYASRHFTCLVIVSKLKVHV